MVALSPSGGSTGLGAAFSVTGTHVYAEEGQFVVRTTITDIGGSVATTAGLATVTDAPLTNGTGIPVHGTVNIPLINVPVATFTDGGSTTDTAADFTATIYHCLGIDPHAEAHDQSGRPFALSRGAAIPELI